MEWWRGTSGRPEDEATGKITGFDQETLKQGSDLESRGACLVLRAVGTGMVAGEKPSRAPSHREGMTCQIACG